MQIVNHCSFKKLTVSLLSSIFPFHVYLHPLALRVQKKPNKTPNPIKPKKNPPGLGFFKKNPGFSEPWQIRISASSYDSPAYTPIDR